MPQMCLTHIKWVPPASEGPPLLFSVTLRQAGRDGWRKPGQEAPAMGRLQGGTWKVVV